MIFSAFKIIREAYYQQLETRGDKTDPELSSWLEWREKNKPSKPLLVSVNRPPQAFSLTSAGRQVGSVKTPASASQTTAPPVSKQQVMMILMMMMMILMILMILIITMMMQVVLPTRPLPVSNTSTSLTNSSVASVKLPTSPVISSLPLGRYR